MRFIRIVILQELERARAAISTNNLVLYSLNIKTALVIARKAQLIILAGAFNACCRSRCTPIKRQAGCC